MEVANGFLSSDNVDLCGKELQVTSLEFPERSQIEDKVLCKTLSPITVYSTLSMRDGKKKTYYYSPLEDEFSHIISKNLVKKIQALTGKEVKGFVNLKPQHRSKPREHICMFKGTVIKDWSGVYVLEDSLDLILLYISKSYGTGSLHSQDLQVYLAEHLWMGNNGVEKCQALFLHSLKTLDVEIM